MSLPKLKTQGSFLDVSFLADDLFDETDAYRLFHEKVLPVLRRHRVELVGMYCAENGRAAIEPVVMLGVSLLQFMKKVPDREAAEQVRLNLGWKFALDVPLTDATSANMTTLKNRVNGLKASGATNTMEALRTLKCRDRFRT